MNSQPHRVPDSLKYRAHDTYSAEKAKACMNQPVDSNIAPQLLRPYTLRDNVKPK